MNLLEMIGDGVNIKPTGASLKIVIVGKMPGRVTLQMRRSRPAPSTAAAS